MRSSPRRARRTTLAALAALALSAAVIVPAAATASGTPELVGDARPVLIESAWATGKVLEVGNQNAAATRPGDAPAAAASFAFGETTDALRAQAVMAYPVIGADDTYVLANRDGEVLTRVENGDADERYLTTAGVALDEAAENSYAQWRFSDAGDGLTYVHNVQAYANGALASLDMYNWANAAGAEIQTYDAGTAAVQKWKIHDLIATAAAHHERVDTGTVPNLPVSYTGRYSWGRSVELAPVEWNEPESTVWETDGTVVVTGTAAGLFGEEVSVVAEYLVGTVGDALDSSLTSYVGVTLAELKMAAPTVVERAISGSDETTTATVRWDWSALASDATWNEGVIEVPAVQSTGFDARLLITLVPGESVNILRGGGINYDYEHLNGTNFALTDGVRDVAGFDDWRSGGAANRVNPNRVSFYFDQPRQLTGAAVYDIAGRKNVGGVLVQYRDLIGGWVDLPAPDISWPYQNSAADLELRVDSDPVLATGLRVIITHKSDTNWMSLSEIEAYGPALAG